MKIRHYIVTYKNEDLLKRGLDIINSQPIPEGVEYEIYVINNYGYLKPMPDNNFIGLNNVIRLDESTGHLARSWNQALILGFENLDNPACDIVILSQGDCVFKDGYLDRVIKAHEKYDFLQQGRGDEFHSYKAEHIKKAGMWDERFCGIGFQELEYFYRSFVFNDNIFINPNFHNIQMLEHDNSLDIVDTSAETGHARKDESHLNSVETAHNHCLRLLEYKYGIKDRCTLGKDCYLLVLNLFSRKRYPEIDTYMTYPYFESGINKDTMRRLRYWRGDE